MKINFNLTKKLYNPFYQNLITKTTFINSNTHQFYKNSLSFNFMTLNRIKNKVSINNKYQSTALANTNSNYNNSMMNSNSIIYIQSMFLRSLFNKRNKFMLKNENYTMRDRKSLRKRIKLVGPSFERLFAFRRVGFRHKRIKKTTNNKNKPKFKLLSNANRSYVTRNLPYFKVKRVKLGRKPY